MTEITFWLLGFVAGYCVCYILNQYQNRTRRTELLKRDMENMKDILSKK